MRYLSLYGGVKIKEKRKKRRRVIMLEEKKIVKWAIDDKKNCVRL